LMLKNRANRLLDVLAGDVNCLGYEEKGSVEENLKKEIVQHITKNLLDIQILRIINKQPTWGYQIKKQIEAMSGLKIRHGALYPLLQKLENKGLITSQKQQQRKRTRKIYTTTEKGKAFLENYHDLLKKQIENKI
ncbi:MAG: PadR family transcriptional regulator, partial [Candidatus Aenigmatarchaeota archaeon]